MQAGTRPKSASGSFHSGLLLASSSLATTHKSSMAMTDFFTSPLDLFAFGFFIGLGWWLSKAIFVIIISKWIAKKPITLDTESDA